MVPVSARDDTGFLTPAEQTLAIEAAAVLANDRDPDRNDRIQILSARPLSHYGALVSLVGGRIVYDPPLPARRDQLTQRMPQGTVIKTMAIYERPFWREMGLSGQATSEAGPTRVVFDNSPPDGSPGVLLGFLEGALARQWGARSAAERRDAVLAGHARLFGEAAAKPVRFVERVWADEEWTRGCYGCLMTPGGWTEYGEALREPIGPLHWAGAETATVWNGYMDGAVGSGEDAARAVLAGL